MRIRMLGSSVGKTFRPEARSLVAGLLAVLGAVWLHIEMTRHHISAIDGMPSGSGWFLLWSFLVLGALGVCATLADRSWRLSRQNSSLDASADRVTDPWAGLLAPYRVDDGKAEAALRIEQVGHVFRQIDAMMVINVVNAVLVALAISADTDRRILFAWLAVLALGAGMVLWGRRGLRKRPPPRAVSKRALRRITVHSGLRGLVWGAAFALFFHDAGLAGKLILCTVSVGMLAGGVVALAPVPSAALLYGLGVMVPTLLRLVGVGSIDFAILAFFGVTFSASMMLVAYQFYHNFATNVLARRAQAEQAATISMLLNEFESSASDWLWESDDAGRLIRLPERMAVLAGLTNATEPPRLEGLLSDERVGDETAMLAAMGGLRSFRGKRVRVRDAAGGGHWLALSGSPKDGGGYIGVGSDITARIEAEAERAEALAKAEAAEQRLGDAIASIESAFALLDPQGRICLANPRFHELFTAALRHGEKPSMQVVVEAEIAAHPGADGDSKHWARVLLERMGSGVAAEDCRMGSGRWLRVRTTPTADGGAVLLLTDVTDIKEQEERLAVQAKKLASSNRELEQFATVASHDLQEPLRKIEAFGGRLGIKLEGKLDDESRYFLERMLVATSRMRALIVDLLSYSRVGRRDGVHRAVDLDRLVAGVLDDLTISIQERHATIEPGRLGAMRGEPTQLRQLFQNIISNALKFMKPDVQPVIAVTRVSLADGGFELRIRDNGIGFDMKHHDTIFEIFQRLHGRDQYEGSGIGLATCRKIAERHGGSLRAESVPGEGTTFIATFPATASAAPDNAAAA